MDGKYEEPKKKEILDEVQRKAYEYEDTFRGCSQATLLALQQVFGLEDENLFKAVSGLAGGIGQMHSVCGALLSGSLFLGLKYGRERSDIEKTLEVARAKLQPSYIPVGRLNKWFEREFGSTICREVRKSLLGVYLDTKIPWQKEWAEELGLHQHCCELAGKTARRVAELIMEEEK